MISQSELKEFLSYNANTGLFVWKDRDRIWFKTDLSYNAWNGKHAGNVAGSVARQRHADYVVITIHDKAYKAHRLAWLYIHGKMPDNQIDHIDGNGLNNRESNLRDVNCSENGKNRSLQKNSTSGVLGVVYKNNKNKWDARIYINKRQKHLGSYDDFFEAVCRRKSAEIKHGYHKNHGRPGLPL